MGLRADVLLKCEDLVNNCLVHKAVRSSPYGMYPTKPGDGGDDCLWLGLLASVGAANAVDGLLNCQSQNEHDRDGMFYRSPERRATNNNPYGDNLFSRDMGDGVILGLISIPRYRAEFHGNKWVNFIMTQWPCKVKKPLSNECLVRYPWRKLAPVNDTKVDVTTSYWAQIARSFRYHGLPLNNQMAKAWGADDLIQPKEALGCPLGYQLHLKAISAYIRLLTSQSESTSREIANTCYRRSPKNLFYKVLSQRETYPEDFQRFLEICPNPSGFTPQGHWCWEQEDPEGHYSKCCGWDMVFLGMLMAKRL